MTDLEQAARAEARRRWPGIGRGEQSARDDRTRVAGFALGASWLAEHLLSDESVERAAKAIRDRRFNATLPHTRTPMWTDADLARAALTAALGTNHNEQEQR